MSASSSHPRRLPWLLIGAGACLAVLALLVFGDADVLGLAGRRADQEGSEGADRLAESTEKTAHQGPSLAGMPAAVTATRGPVRVQVRDRSGAPIEGVHVSAIEPDEGSADTAKAKVVHASLQTDAHGEARFVDLPYDGSLLVEVQRDSGVPAADNILPIVGNLTSDGNAVTFKLTFQGPDGGGQGGEVTVFSEDPGVVSTFASGLRVGLVPTDAPWHVRVPVTGPEIMLTLERGLPVRLEVREGGQGRLRQDIAVEAWPRWTQRVASAQTETLALLPGDDVDIRVRAKAPAGWVAPTEVESIRIHPLTKRLEAIVPLRPEVDLVLEVPEACRPYKLEDCALQINVSGRTLEKPELEALGQERVRVRGAPFYLDDVVTVSGKIGSTWNVSGSAHLGDDPRTRVVVPLTASEAPQGEWAVALGEGLTFSFRTLNAAPLGLVFTDGMQVQKAPLSIRVVAWNGVPAAGARVTIGSTTLVADAAGRVTFPDILDGQTTVVVLGAGAPLTRTFDLAPGVRTEHVFEATAGGTIEVEVVDDKERPAAYPRIDITPSDGQRHAEAVDGTQRIDPYGDAAGRRTFRFVTAGPCKVKVLFGSRWLEIEATIDEGAREVLRVVLPAAKP